MYELMSAGKIGKRLGMSARAVNKRLKEIGLIEGEPGNYVITKKGVEYGNIAFPKNSYGGYISCSNCYFVWDYRVIRLLNEYALKLKDDAEH